MRQSLEEIIAALAAAEATITPPAGMTAPQVVLEAPVLFETFPLFLNIEQRSDLQQLRTQDRHSSGVVHAINAYLLFSRADERYSIKARRAWTAPLLQLFIHGDRTLGGACQGLYVDWLTYTPVTLYETALIATTVRLRIIASQF